MAYLEASLSRQERAQNRLQDSLDGLGENLRHHGELVAKVAELVRRPEDRRWP